MSLQTRLSALITAIGADVKALQARTPTILGHVASLSNTSEPTKAVEWWNTTDGTLIAKLAALTKVENSVIIDRTELWARLRSRTNGVTVDKMILDSNGLSMLVPPLVTALPTTGPGTNSAVADGQECYFMPDATNYPGVIWHLKYRAAEAGPYKWYFVGGGPLTNEVPTLESCGAVNGTYTDLATVGPSVTIPLAGDYAIHFGGTSDANLPEGSGQSMMVIRKSGTTGAAPSTFTREVNWRSNNWNTGSREERANGLAAAYVLRAMYGNNNNGGNRFFNRFIAVRPIRVG